MHQRCLTLSSLSKDIDDKINRTIDCFLFVQKKIIGEASMTELVLRYFHIDTNDIAQCVIYAFIFYPKENVCVSVSGGVGGLIRGDQNTRMNVTGMDGRQGDATLGTAPRD